MGLFGSTWFTYDGTKLVTSTCCVAESKICTLALAKSEPPPAAPVKSRLPSSAKMETSVGIVIRKTAPTGNGRSITMEKLNYSGSLIDEFTVVMETEEAARVAAVETWYEIPVV